LAGYWYDGSAAPHSPTQSDLASEAVRAASHFGNTTVASNASVQYVVATATGNNSGGFGGHYCAYHSSTSSSYGDIAYTNLPYITDAGASCGANFNNLGANAGITIVEGHELAETITDQFPNGGWLDSGGAENGDKMRLDPHRQPGCRSQHHAVHRDLPRPVALEQRFEHLCPLLLVTKKGPTGNQERTTYE
jgi:hypothetical protein